MLRPLPPFRPKPARRLSVPKQAGEPSKDRAPIAVKAKRHPIKVARLAAAPALKILASPETHA